MGLPESEIDGEGVKWGDALTDAVLHTENDVEGLDVVLEVVEILGENVDREVKDKIELWVRMPEGERRVVWLAIWERDGIKEGLTELDGQLVSVMEPELHVVGVEQELTEGDKEVEGVEVVV